jgi:hypothetical protein
LSPGPGQQGVEVGHLGAAGDDPPEDIVEIGERLDAVELRGLDQRGSEAAIAQCRAPPSEPGNRLFLRPSAIGQIERSTVLVSISARPSSRKMVRPFLMAQRVATGQGQAGLAGDPTELLGQP